MEKQKSPVIGLTPLVDVARESYWMLPGYMEALRAGGALPVMLPLTEDPAELEGLIACCDGLLFTGGQDVDPGLYRETDETGTVVCCPARDRMELELLRLALGRDLPVFGICRGLQFLNAALGGSLYRDLPTQHPGEICHSMKPPYDAVAHPVRLEGCLRELLGKDELGVNSRHHQGIRVLAPGLRVAAFAPDGLIEAVELPGKRFVRAVQWHPEHAWRTDEPSRILLQDFVAHCRG